MKTLSGIAIAVVLLAVGFAAGFPVGKSIGFETGSEWALIQARILAREADSFMPVYLADGDFRVVIKQPRNLYRNAWRLSERQHVLSGGVLAMKKSHDSAVHSSVNESQLPSVVRVADRQIR